MPFTTTFALGDLYMILIHCWNMGPNPKRARQASRKAHSSESKAFAMSNETKAQGILCCFPSCMAVWTLRIFIVVDFPGMKPVWSGWTMDRIT
ncbi:hypothetical protein GDO78_020143 [Eleutherodactylus coqui]|uniref:Uncharacterized protein n=1 Tax=Eleutherodactylus coqui TaxID=57060 RepID=A0A8J6EIE1_ELECQ|nr:hypothetical protein GDO78_020143 [Eleutherodactylus coqui]